MIRFHVLYYADGALHRTDGHCSCRPKARLRGVLVIHRRVRNDEWEGALDRVTKRRGGDGNG